MEIEESQEKLRESERKLSAILQSAMDSIISIDCEGKILEFNLAAEKLLGFKREDVLGREMASLIMPQRFRELYRRGLRHFLTTGKGGLIGQRTEFPVLTSDGRELDVEISLTSISRAGPPTFTGFIRNITEEKKRKQMLEQEISLRQKAEALLLGRQEVLEMLAMDHPLPVILEKLALVIEAHANGMMCSILLLDETEKFLIDGSAPALPPFCMEAMNGLFGMAVFQKKSVMVADTFTDPLWRDLRNPAMEFNLRSCWAIPILSGENQLLGAFAFYGRDVRSPNIQEISLISEFCHLAGIVIEHSKAEEQVRRYSNRQKILAESSLAFGKARLDVRAILQALAQMATQNELGDGIIMELFPSESGDSRPVRVLGDHRNQEAHRMLTPFMEQEESVLDPNLSARMERQREGFLLPGGKSQQARELFKDHLRPYLDAFPIYSAMVAPLYLCPSIIGLVVVFRDKTKEAFSPDDLKFLNNLLDHTSLSIENADLYVVAQKAIELREDFMAIASHELKTPLTPLWIQLKIINKMIKTGLISSGPRQEELLKLIEISEQQMVNLNSLIDDLLEVSRLRENKMVLHGEILDLLEIVTSVKNRLIQGEMNGHTEIRVESKGTVRGTWDRLRIEQVFMNLFTNAVKYGGGKPIDVVLGTQGEMAIFEVKDYGIGIPKEHQKRIFGRFERVVSGKYYGGIGLGLYIAREVVKAHGGSIQVESVVGRGSTFKVELPIDLPASSG